MDSDPIRASRILVVRLSALGDVVHALPMLDALRQMRPDAHIGWLVEERAASLLAEHPQIDRLWIAPRAEITGLLRRGRLWAAGARLLAFVRELRAGRYELAIDAQSNGRSSLLSWASGAPRRIGFGREFAKEWAAWLATDRVSPRASQKLKVQRDLELLRPLGELPEKLRAQLCIPEAARVWAQSVLADLGGGPVIVVHPGVSGFGSIKQWEPARFGRTAKRLADERRARCLVTWGPGERALAEQVVAAADGSAVLAPETSSIQQLAALCEGSDLVLGGDTGPLHLAAALGVPVVGLYGPKDPAIYGPWNSVTGEMGRAVRRPVHCSPCRRRSCPNVICMPAIQVDDVVDAVEETLDSADVRLGRTSGTGSAPR